MKRFHSLLMFALFVVCSILALWSAIELVHIFNNKLMNIQSSMVAESKYNQPSTVVHREQKEFSCLSGRLALTIDGDLYYLSASPDGTVTKKVIMNNVYAVSPMTTKYSTYYTKDQSAIDVLLNDGSAYSINYETQELSYEEKITFTKTIDGLQDIKSIQGRNLVIKKDNSLWQFDIPPDATYPIHSSELQWHIIAENVVTAREVSEVACVYTKYGLVDTQYIINEQQLENSLSLVNFQNDINGVSHIENIGVDVKKLIGFPNGDYIHQGRSLSLHTSGNLVLRVNEDASTYEHHAFHIVQHDVKNATLIQQRYTVPLIVFQGKDDQIFYLDERDGHMRLTRDAASSRYSFYDAIPPVEVANLQTPTLMEMSGFEQVMSTEDNVDSIFIVLTGIDDEGKLFTGILQKNLSNRQR